MKTFELIANVTHDGNIEISEEDRHLLPHDQRVRLVVLAPENPGEDEAVRWSRLASDQFLKGYAEADSIYDQL